MSVPQAAPLGLEEFGRLHPWPEEQRQLGRPREWLWWFDLPGDPEQVWPYVADTARLNRAAGLAEMHYTERGGELHGWHRTAGIRNEFVERWQWVCPALVELVRDYRTGLARFMRVLYHLEPREGGGTRLYTYHGWIPRGALGSLAVRIGMMAYEARYRSLVKRVAEAAGSVPAAELFKASAPRLVDARRRRVEALREALREREIDEVALDRLIELAEAGDDMELDRIRVRRLAREWSIEERRLLVTALHATRVGLLELSWDVMCPHCRGVREKVASLGDVPQAARCEPCAIEFGTARQNAIEVTFRVHPSIRPLPEAVYCSAAPVRRAHIRLQQEVGPGESREVLTGLGPGRYRLRRRGEMQGATLLVRPEEAPEQPVRWTADGGPDREEAGPRPTLALRGGEEPTAFVVEETEWDADALQPVHLFNLQEFRDLFSEQYLAAGVQLNVGEQTVLFTDIVGSTRLYVEAGDPTAFVAVKEHFTAVYAAVAEQGGAVVKTIGDAVMAAFSDPVAAVRAARDIHRAFPAVDAGDGASGAAGQRGLRLRVSINTGPCIAVNLNSGIDYFGGTVNAAAKLQRSAGAGEVALSQSVARAPGVAELLAELGGERREESLEHEALGVLPVVVWCPETAGLSTAPGTGPAPAPAPDRRRSHRRARRPRSSRRAGPARRR